MPESEWLIFENTHEAIIDQVTFDNVQRIRDGVKRRPDGYGYVHPLTGLVFCATCGAKLYCHRIYNGKDIPQYVCGNSTKSPKENGRSTGHRISADTLIALVKETLKSVTAFAKTDKAAFAKLVQETLSAQQSSEVKNQKKRLSVCKKRVGDLETLIRKIYEDNALGKLPDKRYAALSTEYEAEQSTLEREIENLQSTVDDFENSKDNANRFMELVKRYEDFDELTVSMVNEFVERIVVHERDQKGKIDSTQKVEIYLNFIGEFTVPEPEVDPELTAAQEEERRKVLERREKLRQNYLKRKASGKQKEWEEKYKPIREARQAEKKVELFAEGAVLGSTSTLAA